MYFILIDYSKKIAAINIIAAIKVCYLISHAKALAPKIAASDSFN
jgi:hypothetical protein